MPARRDIGVNWDEGGMPWTCLPGEPSNINWCNDNSGGGWEMYRNPPQAWIGANDRGAHMTSCFSMLALSVL
jgi:hypothetical protein